MKHNLRKALGIILIILGSIFFLIGAPFLIIISILFIVVTARGGYNFRVSPIIFLYFCVIFSVIGVILFVLGIHYNKKKVISNQKMTQNQ